MSYPWMSSRTCLTVLAAAVLMATVSACCTDPASDGSCVEITPGAFLLPKLNPTGWVQPTGISCDGSIVIGAAINSDGKPEAFRWSQLDGMVGMGYVSGFEGASSAVALSCDGSVIIGFSVNAETELGTAWRWTAATGMTRIMISDSEAVGSTAVDLSEDGAMMLGIYSGIESGTGREFNQNFTWTEAGGVRSWSSRVYLDSLEDDAVGLSGDGYTLISNLVQVEDPGYQGAQVAVYALPGAQGEWAGSGTTPNGVDTPFWLQNGAVSSDGTVLGGSIRRTDDWATPGIWSSATGQLQILPEVIGYVKAVSPDGSIVGGGNDDPGTAFIWTPEHGAPDLVVWLQRYDNLHGTHILDVFNESGGPSNVIGFAANGRRICGTAGECAFGAPCFGFVMDLPPLE